MESMARNQKFIHVFVCANLFIFVHFTCSGVYATNNCKPYSYGDCIRCWRASVTWSGVCTPNCAKQCMEWESADGGGCSWLFKCDCVFIYSQLPTGKGHICGITSIASIKRLVGG
ncbi:uncharacterized protein LOC133880388 [Alnus glutinosa]|uniref:uncharacterized protein LOC133880388 n=1 Tax=Alnus glutinosa TaxID=3517 RepID=UPI002D772527|nr:uncharacterized protein LOC133880388 [Alnus glutinosa]